MLDPSATAETGAELARRAVAQLVAVHPGVPRPDALQECVGALLGATFGADFDIYAKAMLSRGATLDSLAEGYTQMMRKPEYYGDADGLRADRGLEECIRYIWNSPDPRDFRWLAVETSSLRTGIGLEHYSGSEAWPFFGFYGQQSLFRPPGGRLTEIAGSRLKKTPRAVWILVEGHFGSGMHASVRYMFYYDQEAGNWFPLNAAVSPDGEHRPFAML